LALIRFAVYDLDMFGDNHLIAQATYPVSCLRRGFRSVPLKNTFSEHLELAGLLVHMNSMRLQEEDADSPSSSAIKTRLTEAADRRKLNFHSSINGTNQSRLGETADP